MFLLVCYDDVDVVLAAEAVVHCGQEAVGIWGKVDANDIRRFVADDIEEARVLMRETIVVLSPNCGCKENVEGGHLLPPLDFGTLLDPFTVLVHHGVDDVDEWLVAVQDTVSARKNIALEPALTIFSVQKHNGEV